MALKSNQRIVRTFAWASFFNDLGSDMIYPIWPLFVTTVLHANMAVMGLIDGLGEAIVSISQALSGYLSDRTRKYKVFVWLGYSFGLLSRIGYALASAWHQLIPLKILDRAGKMRGAPRDAMVASLSKDSDRGANFGLLRSMDNLGAFVGIIACIILVQFISYRTLFLLAAAPSAVSVLLIIFFIREQKTGEAKLFKGLRLKDLTANFKLLLLLSTLFALGSFSYSFLLLFAKEKGFTLAVVPVFYLVFTALAAASSLPFGRLSDRIGRKQVLLAGFGLWALVCLVFFFLRSSWSLWAGFVLYGLHRGAFETVQKAFVAELAPPMYKASALGGHQMVIGLCAFPASFLAGILWDAVSPTAPFALSLGLTLGAMLLLLFVQEGTSKSIK
ncbi:MFS transporter [candidate division FCPU426 bacterium]|nr:MFS transporter [candidate division FCPU426 bacterium]